MGGLLWWFWTTVGLTDSTLGIVFILLAHVPQILSEAQCLPTHIDLQHLYDFVFLLTVPANTDRKLGESQ